MEEAEVSLDIERLGLLLDALDVWAEKHYPGKEFHSDKPECNLWLEVQKDLIKALKQLRTVNISMTEEEIESIFNADEDEMHYWNASEALINKFKDALNKLRNPDLPF